jgi:flagellar secretion chaperone FliS
MRTNTKKGYEAYRDAQAQELDQAKLILMMFAGAVRFLDRALEIGDGNMFEAGKYISKAKKVIVELISSLDITNSGEMGPILFRTYQGLFLKLNTAHMQNDMRKTAEVRNSMAELEDSWRQVFASQEYQSYRRDPEQFRVSLREGEHGGK